jgi:hypothetical protein
MRPCDRPREFNRSPNHSPTPPALRKVPEMQVLRVRNIFVSDDRRIIASISLGELLVSVPVGNGVRETQQQNDDDFGASRGHANDDPRSVPRRFAL